MKNLHTYLDEVSRLVDPKYKNFIYACRGADPDILNKIVEEATRRYMEAMNAEPETRYFIIFYSLKIGNMFVPNDQPYVSTNGQFPKWFNLKNEIAKHHDEPFAQIYFTNILEVSEQDCLTWREPQ